MTRVVWKYEIPDHGKILMPSGARVLSAGVQEEVAVLWVEVDPSEPVKASRHFHIVATGEPWGHFPSTFIQTVFVGPLVFHVYERS